MSGDIREVKERIRKVNQTMKLLVNCQLMILVPLLTRKNYFNDIHTSNSKAAAKNWSKLEIKQVTSEET